LTLLKYFVLTASGLQAFLLSYIQVPVPNKSFRILSLFVLIVFMLSLSSHLFFDIDMNTIPMVKFNQTLDLEEMTFGNMSAATHTHTHTPGGNESHLSLYFMTSICSFGNTPSTQPVV